MATLGDILRIDESGNYTTSGKGQAVSSDSISAEIARRGKEAEAQAALKRLRESTAHSQAKVDDDTPVELRDSGGNLCGYYVMWQTWDMPEQTSFKHGIVRMAQTPTKTRRLALLRRSFDNPVLTPEQNQEIVGIIDSLLHPSRPQNGRAAGVNQALRTRLENAVLEEREIIALSEAAECLITRDRNGLYLGLFTLGEARKRWPRASRDSSVINVDDTVSFSLASLTVKQNPTASPHLSSRLRTSVQSAKDFTASVKKRKSERGYWRGKARYSYNVYSHRNRPVCCLPYSTLTPAFGCEWIVIGQWEVQLTADWDDGELSNRITIARELAGEEYYEVSDMAGEPSLTLKQYNRRDRKNRQETREQSQNSEEPPSKAASSRQQQETLASDIRHVARDKNGCFLGVFSSEEVEQLWPDCRMYSAMFVVPHTVPFEEAAASIARVTNLQTSFNMRQYKSAIEEACSFPDSVLGEDASSFWASLQDKKLEVRNNSRDIIANLTPAELTKAYQTGWFLVSPDKAQVMVQRSAGAIEKMAKLVSQPQQSGSPSGNRQPAGDTSKPRTGRKAQVTPSEIMSSLGISQEHANVILEQIRLTAQLGYRTKLSELIRLAFPGDVAELPSGTSMKQYHIAGILAGTGQHKLPQSDIEFILVSIDEAMTRAEQQKKAEQATYDDLLKRAQIHKHAVIKWTESVLNDAKSYGPERELATVFSNRRGTVLVMPDGDMYRSVLNTDMDDEAYWSSLRFMPFTHFIVRTPKIGGIYGFGVVADDDRSSAVLIPIPDGKERVGDASGLDKYFRRILFFICANRDFLGMGGGTYRQGDISKRRTHANAHQKSSKPDGPTKMIDKPIVKGRQMDLGMRVVFLSEGPGFRSVGTSSRDIRPHAVAGSRYVNKYGTVVTRKPHWNHGAGRKRNSVPPEIVERNLKYHPTEW